MIVVYPKAIKFQETIVTIYDLSATPTFFTHNLIALRHKNSNVAGEFEMKTYVCIVCGLIYDEAAGMPSRRAYQPVHCGPMYQQTGFARTVAWLKATSKWLKCKHYHLA